MNTNNNTKGRGHLTDTKLIEELSKIIPFDTKTTVRFLPYLDYCIKNQGYISLDKMSIEEIDLIEHIIDKQLINVENNRITSIDKSFYDLIQNILFDAYVCIK